MEVAHKPCPFCGSSDAFSYNTDTGMFNCFSCGATPSSEGGRCYNGEELVSWKELNSGYYEEGINLEPYVKEEYRSIPKWVLEKCGVYFTDLNGKTTVHYAYKNGTKHRELPKTIRNSGKMDTFYGQEDYNGGGGILTITEGEEDRLSVITMMGDYPCVSVPSATPSKEFWDNAREYLKGFEKIYLSLDSDEPGNNLADKFYRMFPGKVYRVAHTKYKDANEFLLNGATKEYKSAWWNAQKVKPSSILCTEDDFIKLYNETPNYEYFPTGIPDLDKKILGIHKGAFTVVLAETGIGKSELFRYFEYKCLKSTDYSIAICHGEETQLRSLLGLVSYEIGANVTRKDLIEDGGYETQVKEGIKALTKDEKLYQFTIKVDDGVDDIVDQVRFLATAFGVDYIFLEPIQDFISAKNTSEKESLLTDLTNKLKRLAPELNVGIVVIAHANKEGEAKYCASIVQGAAYEIRIERAVDSEDREEANTTKVFVGRKNRTGGGSGPAGSLTFDVDTYMLTPVIEETPKMQYQGNTKDVGF